MQQESVSNQEEQLEFDLGGIPNKQLQWTLDVLTVYSFRISQRGKQPDEGRYGTKEWLEALEVLAEIKSSEKAKDEMESVLTLLEEFEPAGKAYHSDLSHKAWLATNGKEKP